MPHIPSEPRRPLGIADSGPDWAGRYGRRPRPRLRGEQPAAGGTNHGTGRERPGADRAGRGDADGAPRGR